VRLLLLYTERGLMNNPRRQGPLRDILMPQKCRIVDPTPKYIIGLSCNIYPACSRYLQADFRHGRCCAVSSSQWRIYRRHLGQSPTPRKGPERYFWTWVKINPATENSLWFHSCRPRVCGLGLNTSGLDSIPVCCRQIQSMLQRTIVQQSTPWVNKKTRH